MTKSIHLVVLTCCLWLGVPAQVAPEAAPLVPGQPLERQMAGGQTHNYQIRLAAGQFMRVVVEPKGIDLSVTLTVGGKQSLSVDVARSGSLESISAEAEAGGDYQLTARALGAGGQVGAGLLRAHPGRGGGRRGQGGGRRGEGGVHRRNPHKSRDKLTVRTASHTLP